MAKEAKKNPKGEKKIRTVKFALTEAQKAEKGVEAAKASQHLTTLEIEKAREMKTMGARIKDASSRVTTLLSEIHSGFEEREVECIEHKDFDKKEVQYWHEGKIVFSRPMRDDDKQLELKDKKPQTGWQKTESLKEKDPKAQHDPKRAAIADVHRLETGKNTSRSALNGPV